MSEDNVNDTAGAAAGGAQERESVSNFEGGGERPPQTEEQIKLAADAEEFLHDVIDPELGSTSSTSAWSTICGSRSGRARRSRL